MLPAVHALVILEVSSGTHGALSMETLDSSSFSSKNGQKCTKMDLKIPSIQSPCHTPPHLEVVVVPTVRVAAAHGGSPGAAACSRALQRPAAGHCRVNLLQRPVLSLVHLQDAVGNVEYENVGICAVSLCVCNLFWLNCAGHKITNVPAIPQIDQISFAGIARNDS